MAARHGMVGEARGIGLIAGLEIVDEGAELAAKVSMACMERGLIVGGLRPGIREGGTLRLAPPLTVSEGEIDEALAILEAALTAVEAGHHATLSVPADEPNDPGGLKLPRGRQVGHLQR